MKDIVFYTPVKTRVMETAAGALARKGFRFAPEPCKTVTHLLLGVPSFEADGSLKGGGHLQEVLPCFNKDICVIGGNLPVPELEGYRTADLLQDPLYLAENADITAHCAVKVALARLPVILKGCQVLIVGWGRIGKCLGRLLKNMGAIVTVAARKEADRALAAALGYEVLDPVKMGYELVRFRVIFNTVPALVLDKERVACCREDCLKLELASLSGMEGDDVIPARGLPGKEAPETSGELIAKTVLRMLRATS